MGAIYKNGIPYGGAPNIEAAAGSHIDESGTPTVTATTSDGTTTFTFDYLKGESSTLPSDNVTGSGTSGQVAVFDGTNSIEGTTLDADDVGAVSTAANQGLTTTEQGNARDNIGLGSAAIKDVPTSGNASTTQVVMGDDTRLSDSRQASDVYSWAKAETKPSYTASEVGAIATTAKGTANGVAELNANGLVPSAQLPSYVDDVLEYSSSSSFPVTGETGKIYVDTTTNKTYRWGGSDYVEISASLALGETDATAYRGDRGKAAYDHSQLTSGNPHNVTKTDVGLGNVGNFKAVSTEASQGLTSTEQENARANIGAGTSNFDGAYSSLSGTPTLGAAAAKGVVTTIDTSSDVPTANAVKTYIDEQGAKTVSGNPITITDAEGMNADHVVATITPTQTGSGTPSPSNVRPFVGFSSVDVTRFRKNLYDISAFPFTNESFVNGATGAFSGNEDYMSTNGFIPVSAYKGLTLTLNKRPGGVNPGIAFYSSNNANSFVSGVTNDRETAGTPMTFTVPQNANYMRFTVPNNATDIQIEINNQATTYEPYQGNQYTVQLGDTYYQSDIDVTNGVLRCEWVLDNVAWFNRSNASQYWVRPTPTAKASEYAFCTKLPSRKAGDPYGVSVDASNALIFKFNEEYESAQAALDAYGGSLDVLYPLATPIEIQLTPQQIELLENNNTIATNASSLDITYQTNTTIGDTLSVLDKRITQLDGGKANGAGLTFSVDQNGILCVTY